MKKISFLLSAFFFLSTSVLLAQSDIDAFRFSQANWEGTARFIGAGGAFGAVGAEYSALSTNPASIGLYKRSEVTFTPFNLSFYKSESEYSGTNTHSLRSNYSLTNAGIVLKFNAPKDTKWQGIQFGYGYNRINDFNNAYLTEGTARSTIVDNYILTSNGLYTDQLGIDEALLYDYYFLDNPEYENQYMSYITGTNVFQKKQVRTTGAIDEMNISAGANYNDKLFIGATLGVPFINYKEYSTYSEDYNEDEVFGSEGLKIDDYLNVKATGINLKLGVIYQPVEFFRFGVALHTPTYYSNVKDYFSREITCYYLDTDLRSQHVSEAYSNSFRYRLTTPLRLSGSIAFLINKRAFISADYEFADYGMANMYSNDYAFTSENKAIQDKYGVGHTIRIGAEVFLTNSFLLRAGYNFQSNPYKNDINSATSHTASAGLGVRTKYFFFDLAYQLKLSKEQYWFYDPALVDAVSNRYTENKVVATLGFKF